MEKKNISKKYVQRETLRGKGQFWTPEWIAEAMVSYILLEGAQSIFDPAVGAGAFFKAAKKLALQENLSVKLEGMEIDPKILSEAINNGLDESDLSEVKLGDFILNPPERKFRAIVANPPYIRHHRLSKSMKEKLRQMALEITGLRIDGRAGLHIYFLIRALQVLEKDGKLAFIMPSDTVEGIFASDLWKWITKKFCLEAVITFAPGATPFPNIDTNPLIFLIRNKTPPSEALYSAKVSRADTFDITKWVRNGFRGDSYEDMLVCKRPLLEALKTGLSRSPSKESDNEHVLADYAKVMRGVASGANEFFFMTSKRMKELDIPYEFFVRAIGRTRDAQREKLTINDLDELDRKGTPTYLFSPDGRPLNEFNKPVLEYLNLGEKAGLNEKALIASRNPWYKMEKRSPPPPILFTYLGRRNSRFIFNEVGATPLTGFLCVYPLESNPEFVKSLLKVLCHPDTIANLRLVGKTYGGGAIKVEPRSLEKLPLPLHVLKEVGLEVVNNPDKGRPSKLFPN